MGILETIWPYVAFVLTGILGAAVLIFHPDWGIALFTVIGAYVSGDAILALDKLDKGDFVGFYVLVVASSIIGGIATNWAVSALTNPQVVMESKLVGEFGISFLFSLLLWIDFSIQNNSDENRRSSHRSSVSRSR